MIEVPSQLKYADHKCECKTCLIQAELKLTREEFLAEFAGMEWKSQQQFERFIRAMDTTFANRLAG